MFILVNQCLLLFLEQNCDCVNQGGPGCAATAPANTALSAFTGSSIQALCAGALCRVDADAFCIFSCLVCVSIKFFVLMLFCLCSTVTQHLNLNSTLWCLCRGDDTFEWTVLQIFTVGAQHLPSKKTADEVEEN